METYVPLEKRSKRKQKEFYGKQRKDWNGVDPVTKTLPSKKIYNRKKSGGWSEHEPSSGFFSVDTNPAQKSSGVIDIRAALHYITPAIDSRFRGQPRINPAEVRLYACPVEFIFMRIKPRMAKTCGAFLCFRST